VVKRSGASEPFNRDKVIDGVRKACKGRPVTDDDLARLGQEVETSLRAAGAAYVPADEVGLAVLEPLRELDAVAYLRFASVYKAFESVDDFADEVAGLMAERAGDPRPTEDSGTAADTAARPAPPGRT
jgi:transcriptional repressor NrdR